jgi:pimeloyl-ACP methyl ester carboxylesterase
MQPVDLGNFQLEYEEVGAGEPVLLIHGGFVDTFFPAPAELSLANGHRVISYHRRGYAGSTPAAAPFSISQQAGDARALLRHLGVERAHLAGHSYGGVIALELARETPDLVGSLALLESGLAAAAPSGPAFLDSLAEIQAIYASGDRAGAVDTFFTAVAGPDYRALIDKLLPPGALDRVLADCRTPFEVELDALRQWSFTPEDAGRIRLPVLSVLGEDSLAIFGEIHALVTQWFPQAESLVVPDANHTLPYMNPHAVSDGMRAFLARHPL